MPLRARSWPQRGGTTSANVARGKQHGDRLVTENRHTQLPEWAKPVPFFNVSSFGRSLPVRASEREVRPECWRRDDKADIHPRTAPLLTEGWSNRLSGIYCFGGDGVRQDQTSLADRESLHYHATQMHVPVPSGGGGGGDIGEEHRRSRLLACLLLVQRLQNPVSRAFERARAGPTSLSSPEHRPDIAIARRHNVFAHPKSRIATRANFNVNRPLLDKGLLDVTTAPAALHVQCPCGVPLVLIEPEAQSSSSLPDLSEPEPELEISEQETDVSEPETQVDVSEPEAQAVFSEPDIQVDTSEAESEITAPSPDPLVAVPIPQPLIEPQPLFSCPDPSCNAMFVSNRRASAPFTLTNMDHPGPGLARFLPRAARKPSTEWTIFDAISDFRIIKHRMLRDEREVRYPKPRGRYPWTRISSRGSDASRARNNYPSAPAVPRSPYPTQFDALMQTPNPADFFVKGIDFSQIYPLADRCFWHLRSAPRSRWIEEADWKTPVENFNAFCMQIACYYSWEPDLSAVQSLYEKSRLGYPPPSPIRRSGWLFFHGYSPDPHGERYIPDPNNRYWKRFVRDLGRPRYVPFTRKKHPPSLYQCPAYWASRYAEYQAVIANSICIWPQYPDKPAGEERTSTVLKDLNPTPSSRELSPLHLRSNQHRPRLLLFNHLSRLWLPLRQDRFLVLLSYLLGGTGRRHVPRTAPFE
ncbi:hypothetical protein QBC34DRAFT_499571 [Podospora aff. communis PSN243]|uniref:Uncharacterized protein n=1 Tax=Podospora aff. communis PSN243 TaxID=3040156 RepID=A0AAV9G677_9PEZI|nr:hypothetical protein QBC34DRAFT_499571 [Podospora aff. communis PSN243]